MAPLLVSLEPIDRVLERFFKFVYKNQVSACWDWIGAKDADGYGRFRFGKSMVGAHRFLFAHENGIELAELPPIGQRCERHCCVRPLHLYETRNQGRHSTLDATMVHDIRRTVREGLENGRRTRYQIIKDTALAYHLSHDRINGLCRSVTATFCPEFKPAYPDFYRDPRRS